MDRKQKATLMFRYQPLAMAIAGRWRRTTPFTIPTEDLRQAALLGLVEGIETCEGEQSEEQMLRHLARAILRRVRREAALGRETPPAALGDVATPSDAEQHTMAQQSTLAVAIAVGLLPDRQREVVNLRFEEGLQFAVIATRLEISPTRVRQIFAAALEALREALDKK